MGAGVGGRWDGRRWRLRRPGRRRGVVRRAGSGSWLQGRCPSAHAIKIQARRFWEAYLDKAITAVGLAVLHVCVGLGHKLVIILGTVIVCKHQLSGIHAFLVQRRSF